MLLIAICFQAAGSGAADEDDSNFRYQTVTTREGLNFRVPEDMPIEKRDGLQVPIPFDEYMYGKFKKMETRLDAMDKKLEKIQSLLIAMRDQSAARQKTLTSQ